jgi:metal-sulfur cluster biosynthetic enzyme
MSQEQHSQNGTTICPYPDYNQVQEVNQSVPATGEEATGITRNVWDALYEVEDPEMPVSIVNLGLIYGVTVNDDYATVDMTLTYTGCPARDMLLDNVEEAAKSAKGIEGAEVRLVWSPGWNMNMITEQGEKQLKEFGLSV